MVPSFKLYIEVDSDSLLEDREKILGDKLHLLDGRVLPQPETLSCYIDLSTLPPFGMFDFYSYCKRTCEYDGANAQADLSLLWMTM